MLADAHSKWLIALPQVLGGVGLSLLAVFAWNPFEQPLLRRTVVVEPTNVNFGELSAFETGKATLLLTNQGREKIEFFLAFECDCVRAEPSSSQIGPGEKLSIALTYRPRGYSDLQSINEELTDIHLKLRTTKTADSVRLTAKALVIKPFVIDPRQTKISANAFGKTQFELNLSLRADVNDVRVSSKPVFMDELTVGSLNTEFNVLTLRGEMHAPESSQKTEVQLEIAINRTDREPFLISLPLDVSVLEPFAVSETSLHVNAKGTVSLSVAPLSGCEGLEIVETKCELPGIAVEATRNAVQVTASENLEEKTGYLQLNLKCRGIDSTERLFTKFILVQTSASESASDGLPNP